MTSARFSSPSDVFIVCVLSRVHHDGSAPGIVVETRFKAIEPQAFSVSTGVGFGGSQQANIGLVGIGCIARRVHQSIVISIGSLPVSRVFVKQQFTGFKVDDPESFLFAVQLVIDHGDSGTFGQSLGERHFKRVECFTKHTGSEARVLKGPIRYLGRQSCCLLMPVEAILHGIV